MKIILQCLSVQKLSSLQPSRYLSYFKQLPNGTDAIKIETGWPLVPGQHYNIMLRGPMPSAGSQTCGPHVADILYLDSPDKLFAVDAKTELTLLDERGEPK